MLDEYQEYNQYTLPQDCFKEEAFQRLRYYSLIKNDFSGLSRAMTIIARHCIFDELQKFDEDAVRDRLKNWCKGWLETYIRRVLFEVNLSKIRETLEENKFGDKEKELSLFLKGLSSDENIEELMDKKEHMIKLAFTLDKKSKEDVSKICCLINALKELKGKRTYFAKGLFGKKMEENKGGAKQKGTHNLITYEHIIANALDQGHLHRYYLACKSDPFTSDTVRKFTPAKQVEGKDLRSSSPTSDKDLILKMTSAYLLQRADYSQEYVIISLKDISNWMVRKTKTENFELDRYKMKETGEPLFEKRIPGRADKKNSNTVKIRIHPDWVKQFEIVDENEIDDYVKTGFVYYSDNPGHFLENGKNMRYGELPLQDR